MSIACTSVSQDPRGERPIFDIIDRVPVILLYRNCIWRYNNEKGLFSEKDRNCAWQYSNARINSYSQWDYKIKSDDIKRFIVIAASFNTDQSYTRSIEFYSNQLSSLDILKFYINIFLIFLKVQ